MACGYVAVCVDIHRSMMRMTRNCFGKS